jgi:endonuclease YncB( thermonuclease family)
VTRALRIAREGVLVLAFFALLLLIVAKLDGSQEIQIHGPFHAIDGDTLAAGDERLRLTGLDAPELDQACADRDRYHRLLVTCHAGASSINAELVRQGMAVAAGQFEREQSEARAEKQGIWSGEFDGPRDWRARRGMMDSSGPIDALLDWGKRLVGWP